MDLAPARRRSAIAPTASVGDESALGSLTALGLKLGHDEMCLDRAVSASPTSRS
jgi:hypothetical protein